MPDEARYIRLQQQNLSKREMDCDEDEDNVNTVGCQTEVVELEDSSCQTDKDLAELTVLQRKN